jgi:predicted transcriptional regulator YheO
MSIRLKRKINPIVRLFQPVVDSIAEIFGTECEVVLHDFSDLEHSIVKIANGHVTGRKVGDPITDLGLRSLKSQLQPGQPYVCYLTKARDGRPIKSSSVLIHDTKGKIVGGLCINLDLTPYKFTAEALQKISIISSNPNDVQETFETDAGRLLKNGIQEVLERQGRFLGRMSPLEKQVVIKELEAKGIFLIKGAVTQVANSLGLSRVSVYKYLDHIRKA